MIIRISTLHNGCTLKFIGISVLLIVLFIADLFLGSVFISPSEVWAAISGNHADAVTNEIVMNFRLPKALTAVLAGAALSVSGVLMQTLFGNPLAGPDVLGVNSGAGLGVALFTMFAVSPAIADTLGSGAIVAAGISGALLVLLLVLLASMKIADTISLLIIGIMFGSIAGSVIHILQSISNPDSIKLFIVWTFGSLSSVTWTFMQILAPLILAGLLLAFFIQKQLDILLLGENYARGLGVSIFRIRMSVIFITALLSGACTAFVGPIVFVGVTVPHIARGLFGASRHRTVIPASILCGASLLVICDLISQLPGSGLSLPLNAVCALLGAPVIVWIIFFRQKLI
jgi:iron complex transport system permease protein